MNDCQNVAVREALPDLVHGSLAESERVDVLHHVGGCADCAGELAIIRSVIAISSSTRPAVDVASIAAAIPAYGKKQNEFPHHFSFAHLGVTNLRLAAALLVGAVGVSALVVDHQRGAKAPTAVAVTHNAPAAVGNGARPGVALVGTSDLTDDHLAQLIQSMAHIDAAPPAEPDPMTPIIYEGDAS